MKKKSKQLRYYYRNREKLIKKSKEFNKKNPDIRRKHHKKYINTPKGIYSKIKKTRKDKIKISKEYFIKWYESEPKVCSYCGIKEKDICKFKINGFKKRTDRLTIDRIDSFKNYENGNLALCCDLCNRVKSNIFNYNEMKEIGKLIIKKYRYN